MTIQYQMSSLKTISGNSPFLNQDGLTVTGNVIVEGDIISTGSSSGAITAITPQVLTTFGSVGSLSYSRQVGTVLLLSPLRLYAIDMAFSTVTSSIVRLAVYIPGSTPTITSTSNNIVTGGNFLQPSSTSTNVGTNTVAVYNPVTGIATSATSADFTSSIVMSGFYWVSTPTTFTPTLTGTGTTGITYTIQQGYYFQVGDIMFFTSYISLTYSGASATALKTNIPSTSLTATLVGVNANINGSFVESPSILSIASSGTTGSFVNTSTTTALALTGSGSLSFSLSGAVITNGAVNFSPVFAAATGAGTWIETSTSYTAKYVTSSGITCFNITYTGTVTATTSNLIITGMPINPTSKTVFSAIKTNLSLSSFVWNGTYFSAYDNTYSQANISLAVSSVSIQLSGYYY